MTASSCATSAGIGILPLVGAVLAPVLAFVLAQFAYQVQKEREQQIRLYLQEGLEPLCKCVDQALAVFRHNTWCFHEQLSNLDSRCEHIDKSVCEFIEPDPLTLELWRTYRLYEIFGSERFFGSKGKVFYYAVVKLESFCQRVVHEFRSDVDIAEKANETERCQPNEWTEKAERLWKEASKYYKLQDSLNRISYVLDTKGAFQLRDFIPGCSWQKRLRKDEVVNRAVNTLYDTFKDTFKVRDANLVDGPVYDDYVLWLKITK